MNPPLTTFAVVLCVACQLLIVVGQLFLKHAIGDPSGPQAAPRGRWPRIRNFALGIACMSLWFFLWLGLLSRWDLSKLYPFEGLNPALMAVAAWLVLKERMPPGAWLGLGLVCAGIAVVAGS